MSQPTTIPNVTRRTSIIALIAAALTSVACGGSGGTGSTAPGSTQSQYYMTATVDGANWTEDALQATTTGARNPLSGVYTLTAYETASNSTIAISLYNITGPGTFPLGSDVSHAAGTAQYSNISSGWATSAAGASGTITITTLTKTEMVGTFSFTAKGIFNAPATSTKTIASGKFDLPVK